MRRRTGLPMMCVEITGVSQCRGRASPGPSARTCARIGRDPAAVLEEVVGQDADAHDFWDRAERNLRGGVVRLVFVADVIPDELATVIEFLNTRMHDTEVCGVEVRRYGSGGAAECFVPRLIGATAAAQAEKRRQTSLDEKLQNAEPEVITAAELPLPSRTIPGRRSYAWQNMTSVIVAMPDQQLVPCHLRSDWCSDPGRGLKSVGKIDPIPPPDQLPVKADVYL